MAEAQIVSSLSVSNDSMSIGTPIEVYYKLTVPVSIPLQAIDFAGMDSLESIVPTSGDTIVKGFYADIEWEGSIADFESKRIDYNLIKKKDLGQVYEYRDTFHATFWDIGMFVLAHPRFEINSPTNPDDIILLESPGLIINVPDGVTNSDTTTAILPITDIILTEKTWWEKYKTMLLIVGFILLTLLILWVVLFLMKKDNKLQNRPPEPEVKIPAHIVALKKLDIIKNEAAWKKGMVKEYHTSLTYIIREYLEDRYDISALESTTFEIADGMAEKDLGETQISDVTEILQIADLVKFAKATTPEDLNEQFLDKARNFVVETQEVVREENADADE